MKITKKTKLAELAADRNAVEALFDAGLHCIGCSASQFENLEQGCKGHGMSDEEISELIKKLNKVAKD